MKHTKTKLISILLTFVILLTSAIPFSAFAAAYNTQRTAEKIYLNTPVVTKFQVGYPNGYVNYNSEYVNYNTKYFSFTPSTNGYYEFNATGYEKAEYETGYGANLFIDVDDADGKSVCVASTNEVTYITRKAAYLYAGSTYYIELDDYLSHMKGYYDSPNYTGYASQDITLTVKKHTHEYTVEKYVYSDYTRAYYDCKYCDYYTSGNFYKPSKVVLSSSKYVYDGKMKTPKVSVKDANGKTISSKYYSVKLASGRTNIGKYKVTVSFKDVYSGFASKSATFEIIPKGTSLKSVKALSKGFTAKWNKQASQTSGYELQYAKNKKFTNGKKTIVVKGSKSTSKKVKKLSKKQTYYVRVRTYKTVSGKKIYSSWSKVKSVKTK